MQKKNPHSSNFSAYWLAISGWYHTICSQYIHTQTKPTETSCSISACMPGVLLADIYSRGDGISKASSKGTLLLLFGVPLLPQGRIPGPFNLIFQPWQVSGAEQLSTDMHLSRSWICPWVITHLPGIRNLSPLDLALFWVRNLLHSRARGFKKCYRQEAWNHHVLIILIYSPCSKL